MYLSQKLPALPIRYPDISSQMFLYFPVLAFFGRSNYVITAVKPLLAYFPSIAAINAAFDYHF